MLSWRLSALLIVTILALSVKLTHSDVRLLSSCPTVDEQKLLNPANKAFLAPITFHGRLLAKWQDEERNLLVKLRVQKVLKNGFTTSLTGRVLNMTGVFDPRPPLRRLKEYSDVVVALIRENDPASSLRRRSAPHSPCPMELESGQTLLVTNGRYLVYAKPLSSALSSMFPRANLTASALPDPFSRRASRTIHKALCEDCGEFERLLCQ